ncbi:GlxA family transcriptional regulator [Paraburkholderia fynbosensis]|uniref:HTH-type transcriptional activator RhaS n=1 Tax=Paraburkholderia fynbosensis TaxID=1200993 RepID=A0A6J5FT19_9BURK|nr:helix-turn-helix domain-containing protein [Paraburkholderia fynbosensis]CAB3786254.1 HTH-type transcriptional activator RhaS [Paraburkholderia fynbosensis]
MKHIGIALFNGFALPEAASIVEAFHSANTLADSAPHSVTRYDVRLLSTTGGRIASSSLVFVWTDSVEALRHADNFDALFIAGGEGVHNATGDERLLTWLRRAYRRSELVLPIAEGRFLLEAAGFAYSSNSERDDEPTRRPGLDPKASLDVSNPLQTALSVIRDDLGTEIARKTAECVLPPASTHFTSTLRRTASPSVSKRIRDSAHWLEANSDRPVAIDEAAQLAAMSERNFLRRFKAEMGVTPSDYLACVRLDRSCRLLVETTLPVDKIARRCGVGSGGQLAKLFRKHLAVTPTEYRASKRPSGTW